MNPLVSVIMSVHNGERFLRKSIESILSQTLSDFEFIIIDDGSTDRSGEIVDEYAASDARIVALHREQKGLTKSLNEALNSARGKYIARQDADDISLPRRLQTMVDFLDANPSIAVAGAWCGQIDEAGNEMWPLRFPPDHDRICWWMIGATSIIHPTAVMRHDCVKQFGVYDESYIYAQDHELWTRWIRLGARLANVPEILVKYRRSDSQVSNKYNIKQTESSAESTTKYVNFLLDDNLRRNEVLGVRQLLAWWPIEEDAVRAIPIVVRLLRVPRFRRSMRFALSTRSFIAKNIALAIRQFGAKDRLSSLSALAVALCISPKVVVERDWWVSLVRYAILPSQQKVLH